MREIHQTIILNPKQLTSYQESLRDSKKKWIFRGERFESIKKSLRTSLELAFEDIDPAIRGLKLAQHKISAEKEIIREFQRKLHLYSKNLPARYDILQWLSLMQHHGAPTRLLDWTYSFWVAVHFAIRRCRPGKKVAIWAVNVTETMDRCSKALDGLKETAEYGRMSDYVERSGQLCYCDPDAVTDNTMMLTLFNRPTKMVLPLSGFRRNQRLTLQQGTFLIPGNITRSFKDNLKAVGPLHDNQLVRVAVINVKPLLKQKINRLLCDMNINNAVLFPGLDGFSQSLWTRIPLTIKNKTLLKDEDLILCP